MSVAATAGCLLSKLGYGSPSSHFGNLVQLLSKQPTFELMQKRFDNLGERLVEGKLTESLTEWLAFQSSKPQMPVSLRDRDRPFGSQDYDLLYNDRPSLQ